MSTDLLGLEGSVAIVTGAGQGAGRGIARQLARAGALVAAADLSGGAAESTAEELRGLGARSVGIEADARSEQSVVEMIERTREVLGPVGVLVNNVGNYGAYGAAPIEEVDWDFWQTAIDQNLRTTFLCSKACAQQMKETGGGGAIVNIASLSGLRASPLLAPYGAVKAGVIQLTQSLALEWAPDRIRVNCVAPTGIEGPSLLAGLSPDAIEAMRRSIPLGELCTPESLGDCVLMLASRLARFVTGQTVLCDGGASITTQRAGVGAGAGRGSRLGT